MSHDPTSRFFIPITLSDIVGTGLIGAVASASHWESGLKEASAFAALLVPIVTVTIGSLVIIDKLWIFLKRAKAAHFTEEDEPPSC